MEESETPAAPETPATKATTQTTEITTTPIGPYVNRNRIGINISIADAVRIKAFLDEYSSPDPKQAETLARLLDRIDRKLTPILQHKNKAAEVSKELEIDKT